MDEISVTAEGKREMKNILWNIANFEDSSNKDAEYFLKIVDNHYIKECLLICPHVSFYMILIVIIYVIKCIVNRRNMALMNFDFNRVPMTKKKKIF